MNNNEYESVLNQLTGVVSVDYSEDGVRIFNKEVDLTFKALIGSSSYLMIDNLAKTGAIVPATAFQEQMKVLNINIGNFYNDWLNKNFQSY